jgi:uncharacterized protein (TIGR02246 family)
MRHRLLLTAALCLAASPGFAQDTPPAGTPDDPPAGTYSTAPEYKVFGEPPSEQDAQAISSLMRRFGQARSANDAKGAAAAFSDDAEWTNAFGDVVRGSANLEKFLAWLFAGDEPGTTQGESTSYKPLSIRYLGDDVAILHGMTQSTRGPARSGEGPRRVHLTWVVAKDNDEWRIVHQMIADARD